MSWRVAVAVLVAGAGVGVVLLCTTGGGPPARKAGPAAPATVPIVRGDLVDSVSVDGRLTYAAGRRVASEATGTLTSVATPGRVVLPGGTLYAVDRRPVTLLDGQVPLYRPLRPGIADGPDVRQLESALRSLGYGDGLTVDAHFSAATAWAVRRWQQHDHRARTGSVDTSQAMFLPAPVRVTAAKAAVGDRVAAGRQLLEVSGTHRMVHVDLDADREELARKGARVTVELPDGTTATGRVASVGTVAVKKRPGDQDTAPTIDLEIALTGPAGRLDQAPVTVLLTAVRRRDVLSVPVEALVARREGGYGLEVARRIVPVTTGVYGGGRVEVAGTGLAAGMRVGVPGP
jgi:peptidoglycan hydrolase-like protein with peptidoglycan-binding domain